MLDKIPPQNMEAEQSVIGSVFLDKEAIYKVMRIISPDDFYSESHKLIYEVILDLNDNSAAIDLLTVTESLRQRGHLDKIGGVTYIASLPGMVPTSANVEYYAKIVEEKSLLRTLISLASRIANMSYEGSENAQRLMDEAERMILELSSRRSASAFTPIKEILLKILEYIDYLSENKGAVTGVSTGFVDLDSICSGFQKGDLMILAARPSMGKTSLGLNVAQHAALHRKIPVAFFSLEMSKEQLVQRMLCAEAMVDQHKLRIGNLKEEDWEKINNTAAKLSGIPVFIDDTPAISIRELRAKARRLQAEHGLGLVVIDYLQLMQAGKKTDNRQQEIAEISRSLKSLAKEMKVPVLALAQLSRSVEQRQDKKPLLSDLRESGSLEQDADMVMFIYRDEYYNAESEKKGIAEIIVAKQRNGPTGIVELGFLKEYTRFVNLAKRAD
ncbi:replicative DNA helicase [Desulfofarcimen acetoxidans DSM 771]|jgi:replicative DNA helicase|uniref:Replicative DNA helicase n=1 Tax=Desulfofarcimen acetoxidans (strain ATCC 49208 / DSM 771 / KCTC 5769 / VKM B-1644 / 5575) TaxID=485916 RepID=C8W044_DESAS|nr:replicative DNA helicase [Desulfofarcimen acetoxidans]ACV65012.1 replicative DNA helicase [Desulfofarcimen acetoxidans DSM 771]